MSREAFSKNKEKRPRTSSGESNNSFVKNVTSRVSGYLPATITKWFSSPRATANGSAPAADATDSSTEDEAPESPVTAQPPAKRMRYTSAGTNTNSVTVISNTETTDISPSYSISSPPARSTFRRETSFASTPIRSPEESVIEREDKETMFPQHTVSVTGPSVSKKRKTLFGDQSQEISEASKKACVKTANNVARDPRQPCFKPTLLGSPFYAGRTTYGGAASSYINQPNITHRQTTTVREAASNTDNNISHSARRVLELLESYSSPLAEAKRIPQYSRPTKQEIAKRISDTSLASPYQKVMSYKTQELHVPRIASILRLKQRSRLNDTTNAARQLIASHSSSSPDYLTHPYGTRSEQTGTDTSNKLTTKVKSRLTRPARGESNALETDTVTPPDLPKAVLQIDPNNLPKFNSPIPPKTSSTDKLIANQTEAKKSIETISKPVTVSSNSIYNFSNPLSVTSESPKATSTPPKFTFGSPERSIETAGGSKAPEPPKPLVNKEVDKKTTIESANWQCPDCWVSNKADVDKCVCCGYKNAPKPASKAKCSLCKLADSQADSDKCVNCGKVQVNNINKPLKVDTSKWKCQDCWVENNETADKCVCCGAKNPKAADPTVPAKKPEVGGMCPKCFAAMSLGKCSKCESTTKPANSLEAVIKSQANKWECEHCLVKNETTKSKCVCCGADRSGQTKEPEVNKFNFGTGINTFKFGIDLKVQEANLAKAAEAPAEKKDKVEESETNNNVLSKAPTFSFGIPAKKPEDETDSGKEKKELEAPKPTFSFGIPKQNSVAPTPAPLFSFSNKVNDTSKTDAEVKDKPQEAKKPDEAPKRQTVIFGAASAPTSTTASQSVSVTVFALDKKAAPSNALSMPATSAEAAPTLSLSSSKPGGIGLFASPTSEAFNPTTTPASSASLFQKTDDTSKSLSMFQKSESPAPAGSSAPASLFQKAEAPAAAPAPVPAPEPAPAAPAAPMFSFGSATASQPQPDKPKFNFTFGANKTDNVFKPPTFGAPTDSSAPKFTLGNNATGNPLGTVNPLASSGSSLTANSLSGSNSLPVNSLGAGNALASGGGGLAAPPGLFGAPAQKENSVIWSAPAPTSAPNPFGANATSNNVAKPFSFGSSTAFNSTTPAFGATTTQAPATPAFGGGAPAPAAFGSAATAAFGSAATPAFGAAAPSTAAPAFGAGAQSAPNIFGISTQNNQGAMFSSPGQSAPMFGTTQGAGGVFGHSTGAFGSPGAPPPAFEAPAPVPAPAPAFNFSSQPAAGVFGFGQQQQQQQQQQQPSGPQTGVYSFGGAPAQGQMQFSMGAPGAAVRRMRKAVRRR